MKTNRIRVFSSQFLFYALMSLSILVTLSLLFPDIGMGPYIIILWILLFSAGVGLIITTYKEKISGKRKLFLLFLGFSSAGFLLFVVLHNLFYALGIITENSVILNKTINFFGAAFFLAAIIICPVALIVGIAGTLILLKKSQSEKS